ncbi:sensor histidine kinase [Halobacillus sp. Marseille-Q1614]|uniref:sensor histidine kinase n=1 Tax=Halobacillus sp. Marseille-Q1614 TaxID=2709134 RepID=UPI001570EC10|nr:sensor histidine kinase [Halobacillus sp. Marseille-Q1614]
MQNWYQIIPKNTGLSTYIWIIFCLLPFFFIFRSSSLIEIIFGIVMILLFFLSYRLSFISHSRSVYVWVSIEMAISITMTLLYGYIYFALFLAFFIGSIQKFSGFLTLYIVHLVTTIAAITTVFLTQNEALFPQLPFVIICVIGVILLPFTMYSRIKREKLEGQLEDANKKISQLMVVEERERIARDLHDTLGQKLSLIGLKSDLAGKLIEKKPEAAQKEIHDINQTARTALNEVREMVSNMRRAKLEEEILRVQQMLEAAEIKFRVDHTQLPSPPPLVENVLSMCLRESVTNVVKHSKATECELSFKQTAEDFEMQIKDNGTGFNSKQISLEGHGLQGMRERLEFVNGSLDITSHKGTRITIRVPYLNQHQKQEESV